MEPEKWRFGSCFSFFQNGVIFRFPHVSFPGWVSHHRFAFQGSMGKSNISPTADCHPEIRNYDPLAILRTWPFWDGENVTFSKVKWPPTRGEKGHGLNHLAFLVSLPFAGKKPLLVTLRPFLMGKKQGKGMGYPQNIQPISSPTFAAFTLTKKYTSAQTCLWKENILQYHLQNIESFSSLFITSLPIPFFF